MTWFYWVLIAALSLEIIGELHFLSKDEVKPYPRWVSAASLALVIFLLIGCLLWL